MMMHFILMELLLMKKLTEVLLLLKELHKQDNEFSHLVLLAKICTYFKKNCSS